MKTSLSSRVTGRAIKRDWILVDDRALAAVPVTVGVLETADAEGRTIELIWAGARSRYGLRGALTDACRTEGTAKFRYEVTTNYLSRTYELERLYLPFIDRSPFASGGRATAEDSSETRTI